jgi:predicted permease
MTKLWRRLLILTRRERFDRDLQDEMRVHLEMKAEAGGDSDDARYAARRQFGNALLLRESSREVWGWGPLDRVWQDVRYGLRMLAKNPSFTLIAVLTLGAGIGVNTAVFTAFNAVALRPLDVPDADRVLQVDRTTQAGFFSYPDYVYLRDNNGTFSGLAAATFFLFSMSGAPALNSSVQGGLASAAGFNFPQPLYANKAEAVGGILVSGNCFKVLGVEPILGRGFIPGEDDKPGAQPVLLLSDNFWEQRFARDPRILGATLVMNGIDFTVIGITPRDFTGTVSLVPAVWAPLATRIKVEPGTDILHSRKVVCCRLYGRLRPDATPQQAQAQFSTLFGGLPPVDPEKNPRQASQTDRVVVRRASPFGAPDEGLTPIVVFGLTAASVVLLIACANLAGLLLARSAARQKEIAVRLAIGASRGRLIRQLLTESVLISALAGAAGLIFAWWALHLLMLEISASIPFFWISFALHLAPDHRVFLYLMLLSFVAAVAFGLAPALEASKPNLTSALKEEGAALGLRLRKSRLRDVLVGMQVAISLVLLIGAGLLARGSQRAFGTDLGFDYRKLLVAEIRTPNATYDEAKVTSVRRRLVERVGMLPGVTSVSVASRAPLTGGDRSVVIGLSGQPVSKNGPEAIYNMVTPDFFRTIRIPIVRGRNFTEQEVRDGNDFDGAPAIVSERTARKFWPGRDPVGQRISFDTPEGGIAFAGELHPHSRSTVIVGVVKDIRSLSIENFDGTCLYLPVSRTFGGTLVLRTEGDPKLVIAALRGDLENIDSSLEALVVDFRAAFTNQPAFVLSRVGAIGSAVIGVLGLLLASVGIYGMVAFAVSQRTHEIGIRMALGADRGGVLGLVLRESMRPVLIGIGLGWVGAIGLSRVLVAFLFGLSTFDPVVFLGVSIFLAAVAALAGYIPARRVTKVDPMVALRYE